MSMDLLLLFQRRISKPIKRWLAKPAKIWKEYGALEYRECVAEDVKVGKLTSFPRSVKLKPGETVIFSWITYKSRKHRDNVNATGDEGPTADGQDGSQNDAV